jgi:hypothetical protein
MARTSGPVWIGALVILVSMPIALFVFQGMWRSRLTRTLPPVSAPAPAPAPAPPPAPASASAPVPVPAPAPAVELRPVDELLLAVFEGRGVAPGRDLMPNGPRVDLSAERGRSVGRVDLDRDGKWDEVWSIELDEVRRYVSPLDDDQLTERYAWTNGAWVPLTSPTTPPEAP